jgi:hypothetical protein
MYLSVQKYKLLDRVRQMPAPRNRREERRGHNLMIAGYVLCDISGSKEASVLLGVTKRTIQRWHDGTRAPCRRNLNKLTALGEIVFRSEAHVRRLMEAA